MITLSIVSHLQATLIAKLLDDIARIDSPDVSSIIVTHNVPEVVPAWPGRMTEKITTIVNEAPQGFGANHNAAFRRCVTPYFVVMNPDLHLTTDPFAWLVERFVLRASEEVAPQRIGMAAPFIMAADGSPEDSVRSLMTPIDLLRRRLQPNRVPAVMPHWLAGMFLFVASDAFHAIGGFDERFFMYCEDFDLCARMRLAGWSFEVVETAVVIHAAQRASHRSGRHLMWHLSSLVKLWTSSTYWRYRRMLIAEQQ